MLPVEIWKEDPEVATRLFVGPVPIARVLLDPYRELADADRTNNAYPPEVIAGRFAVQPGSDRSNPMQAARARDGRPAIERVAREIASILAVEWGEVADETTTLLAESGVLLAQVDPKLLVDPWGRAIRLEFSSSPVSSGDGDAMATLRSDGSDGRRGTEDDVALVLFADGSVLDEAIAMSEEEDR